MDKIQLEHWENSLQQRKYWKNGTSSTIATDLFKAISPDSLDKRREQHFQQLYKKFKDQSSQRQT